jgi:alkylhydroperoxidase family enzyme
MSTSRPSPGTSEVLAAALASRPAVRDSLAAVDAIAWASVDPVLLELCRVRIAMLLGCEAEAEARRPEAAAAGVHGALQELASWPTSSWFGPRERACLAFAEQFVIDVASMPDDMADDVASHLGPQGLADLTAALLVVEQRQRLRLAWQRLGLVPPDGELVEAMS